MHLQVEIPNMSTILFTTVPIFPWILLIIIEWDSCLKFQLWNNIFFNSLTVIYFKNSSYYRNDSILNSRYTFCRLVYLWNRSSYMKFTNQCTYFELTLICRYRCRYRILKLEESLSFGTVCKCTSWLWVRLFTNETIPK